MKKETVKSKAKNSVKGSSTNEIERAIVAVAEEKALPVLSGKQVVEKMEAKIVEIPVPAIGGSVRCQVPNHKTIYDMKMSTPNNEEFQAKLFRACLIDFTEEDLEALEKSNGIKYFEFFAAVMSKTDLFTGALKEANIKN